jgi:hypothetical protein
MRMMGREELKKGFKGFSKILMTFGLYFTFAVALLESVFVQGVTICLTKIGILRMKRAA